MLVYKKNAVVIATKTNKTHAYLQSTMAKCGHRGGGKRVNKTGKLLKRNLFKCKERLLHKSDFVI